MVESYLASLQLMERFISHLMVLYACIHNFGLQTKISLKFGIHSSHKVLQYKWFTFNNSKIMF